MKKLLLIALAVVSSTVVANCYRERCRTKCQKPACAKTSCHKSCQPCAPKAKICERECIVDPMPVCDCYKYVKVEAPCNVKEIRHTSFVCSCPAGYTAGEQSIAQGGGRTMAGAGMSR